MEDLLRRGGVGLILDGGARLQLDPAGGAVDPPGVAIHNDKSSSATGGKTTSNCFLSPLWQLTIRPAVGEGSPVLDNLVGNSLLSALGGVSGEAVDLAAVRNSITETSSNGQTEGQINRLKTLKRAMYGSAGIELLRVRVLPIAQPICTQIEDEPPRWPPATAVTLAAALELQVAHPR